MKRLAARAEVWRALSLLAGSPEGSTQALLLAYGFTDPLIARLIKTGLVVARADRVYAGGRPVRVTRIKITDAGRVALER